MTFLTKSREMEWQFKGEITAFLSLIFILMLSVVGALIESASIQITRSRKRADVNLALESTFAEYHPEMLHTYDLFVRFGSSEDVLQNRLEYYGATDMTHEIQKLELLTDHQGSVYYNQAVRYMKDWLGIEGGVPDAGQDLKPEFSYETERDAVSGELAEMLEAEEAALPEKNNPLGWAENLKAKGILALVVSDMATLSNRSIDTETLPSQRTLQKGNFQAPGSGGLTDRAFFTAYLTEHFSDYVRQDASCSLLYEQEYLLGGKAEDQANLEAVCSKLANLRMAINYGYLLTDSQRQAEAEALAVTLCSLLANPEISGIVKHALLLVWAYGESIVDVRALLKQKKVPLVKTSDTWQLQLANVAKLGTAEEVSGERDFAGGLTYQDYVKELLMLEQKENLCMRSLDLMEANLHLKVDECMTKVEMKSKVKLRRGAQDTFVTTFGYQ